MFRSLAAFRPHGACGQYMISAFSGRLACTLAKFADPPGPNLATVS